MDLLEHSLPLLHGKFPHLALPLRLITCCAQPSGCSAVALCVTQAQANDSNPWLDKEGVPLWLQRPNLPSTSYASLMHHLRRPGPTVSARAGNPVERFDAIIMDRPWLFHWKKAFIFIPVQGLLIATGTITTSGRMLIAVLSSFALRVLQAS